jgi:Protein of unknown function (DUF1501)
MNTVKTRREFLANNAMGVGSMALAWLLQQDDLLATPAKVPQAPQTFDMQPKSPPHAPQANAMVSLFMHGGPSHMDLLDPKPELTKYSGTEYADDVQFSFINRASKTLFGSPWRFQKHGECGTAVSELLPHFADIVDEACVIRSMHTGHNGHEVSIRHWHSGIPAVLGRPTLGAWLTYGLGCESQDLPAYMVLTDPAGHPVDGVNNWTNGWMPPLFQGTVLRPNEPRILNLQPPAHLKGELQRQNPRVSRAAESVASGSPPGRERSGSTDRQLRTRGTDANRRHRGARYFRRDGSHFAAVRHRSARHAGIWHTLFDRAAIGRTRRPIRATVPRRATLGQP